MVEITSAQPVGDNDPPRVATHRRMKQLINKMNTERSGWFQYWRTISEMYLPLRYATLGTNRDRRTEDRRNRKLLSSVSTQAIQTLASGMQDGITSPARRWFRLRLSGFREDQLSQAAKTWLEDVADRMLTVLAESNFYDALSIYYLEWAAFGTGVMQVAEDFDEVVRFYNYPPGEYYLAQDDTRRVRKFARVTSMSVYQVVQQFGIENVRPQTREKYERGGAALLETLLVYHLVVANDPADGLVTARAPFREAYWEEQATDGEFLRLGPAMEWPIVSARWEVVGNDTYGISPAMKALADVKQLQVLIKKRVTGLGKMVSPPMIADNQLRNRPKAFSENGITYANTNNSNFGARPVFQVQLPYNELVAEEQNLVASIRETCFNHLFAGISQLDTVRSATEVSIRDQERLVLLGPVLSRFENEGLDVILGRLYGIMRRNNLLPDPPEELDQTQLNVQYVSILSDAQRAVGTASTEQYLAFSAQVAGAYPEVLDVPDAAELMRDYGERIGVPARGIRSREQVAERQAANAESEALQQQVELGSQVAGAARELSQADVGGGLNALQAATQ